MNYPLLAIVGQSGTGKSSSLRNLPPSETVILNLERKILPFRPKDGLRNLDIETIPAFNKELDAALKDPKVRYIVIESFTHYIELLESFAKSFNKGYDIWNYYNEQVGTLLEKLKKCGEKFVIITAIDEFVETMKDDGAPTQLRRIKVAGKKWEGLIESKFTYVLFTKAKIQGESRQYLFIVNTDGINSAKSPDGVFPTIAIDNDAHKVCEAVRRYHNLGDPKDFAV